MCYIQDEDGLDKWNYRSVIGNLNWLAGISRPELAFVILQCAKYTSALKLLHEKSVKRIGRYLLGTYGKGIILKPSLTGKLDAYVDADFVGLRHPDYADLRESVLSRSGYFLHK